MAQLTMTPDVSTTNGMKTHRSTLNANTDLFFQIGAMRNVDEQTTVARFKRAYDENPETALRISLYSRDVLQGQGERETPRRIWKWLTQNHPDALRKNLHLIPELGYWKDILIFFNTDLEKEALEVIAKGLADKNGLCAKWMPRKGEIANKIRKHLNVSPKVYRKTLVELTRVVETQMCAKDWTGINYQHVPSKAAKLYRKAFKKHDEAGYTQFMTAVKEGTAKINAKAMHPHEIVGEYIGKLGYSRSIQIDETIEAQWKALPNFLEGHNRKFIAVCDTSGSMAMYSALPMQVCIALGIYVAERNVGPFKDAFITFSSNPTLQILRGNTLAERVQQLETAEWNSSTNLEAVFRLILNAAVNNRLNPADMPAMVLIMSDMEFNSCATNNSATAFTMIKNMYTQAGYEMPSLVFWNLNAQSDNYPVAFNQEGVALVSGFSPSIMKQLLSADGLNPEKIMLDTISSDRYNVTL